MHFIKKNKYKKINCSIVKIHQEKATKNRKERKLEDLERKERIKNRKWQDCTV
jgi:hypothetical protein